MSDVFPAITGAEVSDKTPGKQSGTGYGHESMHDGNKAIDGQKAGVFTESGAHNTDGMPDMPGIANATGTYNGKDNR